MTERELFAAYGVAYETCTRCGGPACEVVEGREMGNGKKVDDPRCATHVLTEGVGHIYTPRGRRGLVKVTGVRQLEVPAYTP